MSIISQVLRRIAIISLAALALTGCGPSEPAVKGLAPQTRVLTEGQYRAVIADIFGADIKVAGRFDPIARTEGLIAVGASKAAITPSAFERFDRLARSIAAQVVDQDNRTILVGCKPASLSAADDVCASQFYRKVGRLLYRRPLNDAELTRHAGVARVVTQTNGDFYDGLAAGLAGMLVAPDFLLIGDTIEPDPAQAGQYRLDAYAKASRLSFFLWSSGPDDALLRAAEAGELHDADGLAHQVDRMLASPRLESGMRAFFSDMLGFDRIDILQKDPIIYPAFGLSAANDAREQTLRTIVDLLVYKDEDYRSLFTTRKTFLTNALGMLYRLPVERPEGWAAVELPIGDYRAGIQSHISLLALNSHPGRSSPTLRGQAIRELLMCQKIPAPPGNVDFTLVSDSANPAYKTARERLGAHNTEPSCAGCHKLMDPIGLTLENFDGAGQFRATENGAAINASGDLDGTPFRNGLELGQAMHDNPATRACVVNRLFAYATGAAELPARTSMQYFEERFAKDGYRLKKILRTLATSRGLYAVATPPRSES